VRGPWTSLPSVPCVPSLARRRAADSPQRLGDYRVRSPGLGCRERRHDCGAGRRPSRSRCPASTGVGYQRSPGPWIPVPVPSDLHPAGAAPRWLPAIGGGPSPAARWPGPQRHGPVPHWTYLTTCSRDFFTVALRHSGPPRAPEFAWEGPLSAPDVKSRCQPIRRASVPPSFRPAASCSSSQHAERWGRWRWTSTPPCVAFLTRCPPMRLSARMCFVPSSGDVGVNGISARPTGTR
jgi:hypothetical protein